ncbi:MAG: hypothetical protein LBR08_08315 [Bacteroidales bacterium]|jgi:hypothetical protein|nr:hypothetical protein [Bacteroidales bacterium]
MKKNLVACMRICFFWLLPAGLSAQDAARPQILVDIEKNSRIEIIQPPQAEMLLNMQIANNHLQKGISGYRIRIFSQSGQYARQRATEAKTMFMRNFPDVNTYWKYNEPNYQIFVGDFRTKTEALYQYKQISKKIPSAFIVKDIINIFN